MPPQNQLAVQRKTFLDVVNGDGFKAQLALALPKHVTADRLLRICLSAMNKVPDLYECTPDSVMAGIMTAGQLGLEIDGRKAALVPFKDTKSGTKIATLIVGYQGFIDLAYRHPKVHGIRAKVVYEKDSFVWDEGLHPKLEHKPYEGEDDPGKLRYAYAICYLEGGGATFVVVNRREVMKAKANSRSAGRSDSPWNQHEASMWMKTAVRRLAPFMPQSSEMTEALSIDSEAERAIDVQTLSKGLVGQSLGQSPMEQLTQAGEAPEPGAGPSSNVAATPGPDKKALTAKIQKKLEAKGVGKVRLMQHLIEKGNLPQGTKFEDLDAVALDAIDENLDSHLEEIAP